jgi:hypothetical protein
MLTAHIWARGMGCKLSLNEAVRNLLDFRDNCEIRYQIQVNLNLVASVCHSCEGRNPYKLFSTTIFGQPQNYIWARGME